jgi:D-xylose transport system ATP-binding protein
VSEPSPPALELRGVSKSFGSVQALQEVDFEVRDGEVMALVGDNGAGKSTLIKCVAGINSIDGGEILFDGKAVSIHGPKDAAKLGIEVVYQDLALCDNLDVVQNMYLGREERDFLFRMKESPMEQKTTETLASLSVTTLRSVRQPVATLSGGQRQSVAVARAVMWNNRVVFLDEPTAALGVAQTRQVLALVKRLAEQGIAVVLVSHNLVDVFEVADRITVLRLGRNIGVYQREKTNQQEIVEAITFGAAREEDGGRDLSTGRTGRGPGSGYRRRQPRRAPPRALGGIQGRRRRQRAGDRRGDRDHDLLHLEEQHLLHRGQLLEPDPADGGGDRDCGRVVFVLLIGEIDLSVGYVSGLAGVVVAELQLPARATTTRADRDRGSRSSSGARSAPRRARSSPSSACRRSSSRSPGC